MNFNHIAVVNSSMDHASKFYGEFLGLEKSREYLVPADLSRQLFAINSDIIALVYEKNDVRFEIFIHPDSAPAEQEIRHAAIFVKDLDAFLKRTATYDVDHIIGKTSEKTVHFIKDYSGNMIEVKQKS